MANDAVTQYLAELEKSEFLGETARPHSFAYMIAYYSAHAGRKRNWFRVFSITLISLSAGLPVYSAFTWPLFGVVSKDVAVGVTSGFIALLTGLLSFFRWEVGWRGQNEALFALVALRAEWDASIAAAHTMPDAEAIPFIKEAYASFTARTFEVVHAEMGEFFKVQQSPPKPS